MGDKLNTGVHGVCAQGGVETMGRGPRPQDYEVLLKPGEVARRFNVDARTVRHWAKRGKLTGVTTPMGLTMYYESQVMAVMAGEGDKWVPPPVSTYALPELPEPMDLERILEDGF